MKRAFLLIFFSAFYAFSLMAYESPITAPGAGGVEDMYTTADGNYNNGPNYAPGGPHKTGTFDDSPEGGTQSEKSPIGAPFILLAFAAAYAGVVVLKRRKA